MRLALKAAEFGFTLAILTAFCTEPSSAKSAARKRAQNSASLCWQDYCPCQPPQGGPDMGLCRQLKAGMHVDPQLMAAAAMMRDARKQMDDFCVTNPDFGNC